MYLIECLDLKASYGSVEALRGVRLTLRLGEIVGLCGPNKAGKSTLARCLAGTMAPNSGRILWQGHDITQLTSSVRLSLGISLCPEGRGIYRDMSVRDNLRLGAGGDRCRRRRATRK